MRAVTLDPRLLPDIGHVDFLEAVHGLAERPYIIVGLHFDQVSSCASLRALTETLPESDDGYSEVR